MGHVEDVVCEELTGMIDVNCKALVAMTKITLPYMKEQSNINYFSALIGFVVGDEVGKQAGWQ